MRRFKIPALLVLASASFQATGCPSGTKEGDDTSVTEGEGAEGEGAEGEGAEGEGAEGEGAEGEGAEGEGAEGEGAEGEGEGTTSDWTSFHGTFTYQVAEGNPSSVRCTLYWDSEGTALTGVKACPDCQWSMDFENTYTSDDGSCGDGSDFNWYWGLEPDYYISGYGTYPVFDYYFSGYGWYPYVAGTWDESTGAASWLFYDYNYYSSSYTFYYTLATYGYAE